MRAELIGYFKACMTEIYLHIDARMADYIRTHLAPSLSRTALRTRATPACMMGGCAHAGGCTHVVAWQRTPACQCRAQGCEQLKHREQLEDIQMVIVPQRR